MDRGAWWATVHGVAKRRTRLNDFTFTFHFHALEKEMATHPSVLAWGISGMEEPGGKKYMLSLQCLVYALTQRVQEDPLEKEMATQSSTLAWKIPWMEEPGRL